MPTPSLLCAFTISQLPEATEALRQDVKAFLADRLRDVPVHRRARTWSGFDREFSRDLAARGWPIVGDAVYGRASERIGRQALHAWRLAFVHPRSNDAVEVSAEMPADMQDLVTADG